MPAETARRLLIITSIFPPDIGGPATYVSQIAAALAQRGHGVTVVTLTDRPNLDDRKWRFRVVRIPRQTARPWRWLRTILTLISLGRHADVLFVNGLAMESVLANLILRKPLVHKVVGDLIWERVTGGGRVGDGFERFQQRRHGLRVELLRALRAWWTRRADAVIVPSRYLARWVAAWGVPERKVTVIHNAASPLNGIRVAEVQLPTPLKMVTVGRLIPLKRVDDVIKVVARLKDTGLLVVGDGPERRRLEDLASALRISNRIHFTGQKTKDETLALMARCDVLVLNSIHEGFPHAVVEALGLGLPVVATAVGGTPEAVRDGENGRLIAPSDPAALERVLAELIASHAERRRLADGAARTIDRFSLRQMTLATEACLLEVTSGTRTTATAQPAARRFWRGVVGRIPSRFVQRVGALTIGNALILVLNVLSGFLIARWMGPERFGIAALIMSYPSLVFMFFDARSVEASVKYLSEFQARQQRDHALAICKLGYMVDACIACVAFLAAFATAPWAARWVVHRPEAVWLIVVYAAAYLPRALFNTSYAVLATLGRFFLIAWVDVLSAILRVGLTVGLVLAGWQVAGVVWGNAIALAAAGILNGMIAFSLVRRTWGASPLRGNWQTLKGRRREIVGFLLYNDLIALLGMIPKQLDVVLLGYFRNPTEVGYYKLARGVAGIVGNVVAPLQSVAYPEFARLWGLGDWAALRQRARRLATLIGLPLGAAALASTAAVPLLLSVLVGPAYRPAIVPAQLLLIGSATWMTFFWLRPLYLVRGELRGWATITLAAVSLSAVGFIGIIPSWGYVGLAGWMALVTMLSHSWALIYARRKGM